MSVIFLTQSYKFKGTGRGIIANSSVQQSYIEINAQSSQDMFWLQFISGRIDTSKCLVLIALKGIIHPRLRTLTIFAGLDVNCMKSFGSYSVKRKYVARKKNVPSPMYFPDIEFSKKTGWSQRHNSYCHCLAVVNSEFFLLDNILGRDTLDVNLIFLITCLQKQEYLFLTRYRKSK